VVAFDSWPDSTRASGRRVSASRGFLSDEEIIDFKLARDSPGKQGEGHSVLAKDKTFLLSAQDGRQIALRQFSAALESAEHGLAINRQFASGVRAGTGLEPERAF